MGNVKFTGDVGPFKTFNYMTGALEQSFNNSRHLNNASKAAFYILRDEFNRTTHAVAAANVENYHHVYEWDAVGVPGMHLWNVKLTGRGGHRSVTWDWRASKTTVPTETTVSGDPKFGGATGFKPGRLKQIHVFVWKAPIMEYGTLVTISPKLSKVLVFPNPGGFGTDRDYRGPRPIVFTNKTVTVQPGKLVQGNFTTHFLAWWANGPAQTLINNHFEDARDNSFKRLFSTKVRTDRAFKPRGQTFKITPDALAARRGKNIAKALARNMEHEYIKMAQRRKLGFG